jgi:aryl-alcohol dehydrogenase-like predicted oxidoreductase
MSNKLILGTAQFGMDYGINNATGKIPKTEVFEILKYAFQNGIKLLDTAPVYGDAHKIIGEFHKDQEQIRYNVITKIPANYPIEKLEELVDSFLLELNIDCIEVLHFHSINDYKSCEKQNISEVFSRLKHSRKVKTFGVSIYENSEADFLNRELIDVVQLPFNLLDNTSQRSKLIDQLKQRKYEIHTRSIFLQGLFFKNLGDIISSEIKEAIIKLQGICKLYRCDIAQLALQYCLVQKEIDHVLIGVDSIEHLKKNISMASDSLATGFVEHINNIVISDISQINPNKWRIE